MPTRTQATPYGDVAIYSRVMRSEYYLVAYGPHAALTWLMPPVDPARFEQINGKARFTFKPAPVKITVMRDLVRLVGDRQAEWTNRLRDHELGMVRADDVAAPLPQTFGELIKHVEDARRCEVAVGTMLKDKFALMAWTKELGDHLLLTELTPTKLRAILTRWIESNAGHTIATRLGTLKAYLNRAEEMKLIKDPPHRGLRRIKIPLDDSHKTFWTAQQVAVALDVARRDRRQPTAVLLVAIGCHLGLRVEEAIMLRWQDLDLDATQDGLHAPVCHIVPHDGWKPKDGDSRTVPINATLLAILRDHRQPDGYVLTARHPRKRSAVKSYRYDPRALWLRLMKKMVEAGLPKLTMGEMRHSFASNLIISGVNPAKASNWMGHSDQRMVNRFYAHHRSYDADIERLARPQSALQGHDHGSSHGSSGTSGASK